MIQTTRVFNGYIRWIKRERIIYIGILMIIVTMILPIGWNKNFIRKGKMKEILRQVSIAFKISKIPFPI